MLLLSLSAFATETPRELPPSILPYLEERTAGLAKELGTSASSVRQVVHESMQARLQAWPGEPTEDDLRRKLVDFEVQRLRRYVSSGVFPKRYFGYLDLRGDTAERERQLRTHIHCTVGVLNRRRPELRVSDLDVVVTFISEGGTLMLQDATSRMEPLHPVFDVGLDDIARGLHAMPELAQDLDASCGTDFGSLVLYTPEGKQPSRFRDRLQAPDGKEAWLMRRSTFAEAVAGTALMWVWEIDVASRKLANAKRTSWVERDADERFIIGSLIYNSGILHTERTHRAIREFSTGPYLHERSEANVHRRSRLNLQAPPAQLAEVLTPVRYREQPTSWVAVYHVLQRYGARAALKEHTDWFDEHGAFRPMSEAAEPDALLAATSGPTRTVVPARGCSCSTSTRWNLRRR